MEMHYNGRTNIYVIFKVQVDFALEVWFSIFYILITPVYFTALRFNIFFKFQSEIRLTQCCAIYRTGYRPSWGGNLVAQ